MKYISMSGTLNAKRRVFGIFLIGKWIISLGKNLKNKKASDEKEEIVFGFFFNIFFPGLISLILGILRKKG